MSEYFIEKFKNMVCAKYVASVAFSAIAKRSFCRLRDGSQRPIDKIEAKEEKDNHKNFLEFINAEADRRRGSASANVTGNIGGSPQ